MGEETLCIIKPDAVERNLIGDILGQIEAGGLRVKALKMVWLSKEEAQGFYAVHRDKPFFDSLTDYMSSGPVVLAVLEGENAVEAYRGLMGPTNPSEASPSSIRGQHGRDIEKNSVHGSDSPENAKSEIAYFFNRLEVVQR
jgi:nucleoside-diphosphate kinase